MKLADKLKISLNENRLLILGTQVVFGFQFNGIFQDQFDDLPPWSRLLAAAGLPLLMAAMALLISPSMQHRIVERGQDTARTLRLAMRSGDTALMPLSIALAFDVAVALERVGGAGWGIGAGTAFFVTAMVCWYGLALIVRTKRKPMSDDTDPEEPTPLKAQVDQLLTEARLIIPGAQALLGFQLTVTLTRAFAQLPAEAKIAHAAALCCVALAVVLLMAPASLHRISFSGNDDPQFVKIGSAFVIAAPLPLAFAIALDTYVATGRALSSGAAATALGLVSIAVLLGTWYGYPAWYRLRQGHVR